MVLLITLMSLEGLDVAVVVFLVTQMFAEQPGTRIKESCKEGATGMSFIWGCCFHALFQILGNPDVLCRSHSKTSATGLSVVR